MERKKKKKENTAHSNLRNFPGEISRFQSFHYQGHKAADQIIGINEHKVANFLKIHFVYSLLVFFFLFPL